MQDFARRVQRRLPHEGGSPPLWRRPVAWLWGLALAWLLWMGLVSEHSLRRIWELERQERAARAELQAKERKLRTLRSEASDPSYQQFDAERRAREEMGMAVPGELVYRVQRVPADSLRR